MDRLDTYMTEVVTREDALADAIDMQIIQRAVDDLDVTAQLSVSSDGFRLTVIDNDGMEIFDCDWTHDLRTQVAMWLVPPEEDEDGG